MNKIIIIVVVIVIAFFVLINFWQRGFTAQNVKSVVIVLSVIVAVWLGSWLVRRFLS